MSAQGPVATYRFQLTPAFGFDHVIDVLDHVQRLGVSHVYLSPIAQAIPESTHGYDVVDHTAVRHEFGGADGFERLLDQLASRSMAAIIDHVPNHVASARPDLNRPWWELLRDGRGSHADRWFDVDWAAGDGKVILPVIGAPLPEVIAAGDVEVADDELVVYGERRLPLRADVGASGPLAELIDRQHYELRCWRDPARNVRRFFTIDDLVAVRVEEPAVAEVVDALPVRYAGAPGFGGVRIDHVDGLADPLGYLVGLRDRIGPDLIVWVEKIVAPGEWLPTAWPVEGTTGYEFARICDQVLLAADAVEVVDRRWLADAGDDRPFHRWEHEARVEVVAEALAPDLERLGRVASRATGRPVDEITDEIQALTTELPRYRTYLPGDDEADRLIGAISTGPVAAAILDAGRDPARLELRTRWQQLTGPVMAKGAEDRSFYRYLRLASLCEVGGDPGRFGIGVDEFHADNLRRQRDWPLALLSSSTHDTKRSEDVRARSAALTWRTVLEPERVAAEWADAVERLTAGTGIDAVTASLAHQTVLTTPGLDAARLRDYLLKAAREAAVHTTWERPDAAYEARLGDVAGAATAGPADDPLGLDELATGISLAATALRLTAPGVPDIYQGAEGFTHRLVDPDNRVPPDWPALAEAASDERTVADAWIDGLPAIKTILIRSLLALRRRRSASFGPHGEYRSLDVGDGAIAYRRGDDAIVVVRRGAAAVAGRLEFPSGTWYDVLDPEAPTMSGAIDTASAVGSGDDGTLPIAVFERE